MRYNLEIQLLGHTSEENDWQRGEDQVVQQNERVLVKIGSIETSGVESAFPTRDTAGAYLLNSKNQNIANTQITFYWLVSTYGTGTYNPNAPYRRSYYASPQYDSMTIVHEPRGASSGTGIVQRHNPQTWQPVNPQDRKDHIQC